ncbi:MAG: GntR family transcriptional regulator [Clostridiales bacterium]|nr:GntR family transcriptional regulator [Clostridiales bacterium]
MQEKLDFSGRTQLYYQLFDILCAKIKSGEYAPGDMLPTENDLVQKYKVSRITVRKAMDLLYNEGLISRKRGYGTIVKPPKMDQTINKVVHFSSEMEKRGQEFSTKMLANEKIPANKHIASELGIMEKEPLIHVNRLRHLNKVPICLESAFLLYEKCPDVVGKDFSKNSLRLFLESNYNIVWKRASQKIYAILADKKMAKILDIDEGSPLIYIERISYDKDDKKGEFFQGYYRADSYYLTAELEV